MCARAEESWCKVDVDCRTGDRFVFALVELGARRVNDVERRAPAIVVNRRCLLAAFELFEGEAIEHESLLNGRLMQRGVHRLAKIGMAVPVPRSVDADGRAVDHDANGFGPADEQPRLGRRSFGIRRRSQARGVSGISCVRRLITPPVS